MAEQQEIPSGAGQIPSDQDEENSQQQGNRGGPDEHEQTANELEKAVEDSKDE